METQQLKILQFPVGIMKMNKLSCEPKRGFQPPITDVPSKLAWNVDATSLAERYEGYEKIAARNTTCSDGLPMIRVHRNDPSTRLHENDRKASHLHVTRIDPLQSLRVQQPHLASEIEAFYFERCPFVIGDVRTTDNISNTLQWLRDIGETRISQMKQLHVYTTQEELQSHSADLLDVLRCINKCIGHRDFELIDFCVRQPEAKKDYSAYRSRNLLTNNTPYTSIIGISGLPSFVFWLRVHFMSREDECDVTTTIRTAFQSKWDACPQTRCNKDRRLWLFSRVAKRVNYTTRLPVEVRLSIQQEANVEISTDDASLTNTWSRHFHCHRDRLVSKGFVQDFVDAFYFTQFFKFRQQSEEDYVKIHNFLSLAGPQVVTSLPYLAVYTKWRLSQQWHVNFSWLANTLNSFSSEPSATREAHSLKIAYFKVRATSKVLNLDRQNIAKIDLHKILEENEAAAGVMVELIFTLKFTVRLVNETLQPFSLTIFGGLRKPMKDTEGILEAMRRGDAKEELKKSIMDCLQGKPIVPISWGGLPNLFQETDA